jgi:predicted cupin superfamily sugar epimerase
MNPNLIIQKLNLEPLPGEGGFFRRTFTSSEKISNISILSSIYFLVTQKDFSALHRLCSSDEIFHFYAGSSCEMIHICQDGTLTKKRFGPDILAAESPQIVVPRGVWQGLRVLAPGEWALMGTTVVPEFLYSDFELGKRDELLTLFPQHQDTILRYTRE